MDYYIAFWNVENLFDVKDSPQRSEKLKRVLKNELAGWTAQILEKKLDQLASIIKQMNSNKGPDLLGVCEVENAFVLEMLADKISMAGRSYKIAHDNSQDRRGIDVAFIYDSKKLKAHEQFSHFIQKRTATRDLFQVNFKTRYDNLLVVIGNHWPSRLGGQYESEPYRMMAGETLSYFHERIRQVYGKDVAILAMGDFNDEPFNRSLTEYARAEQTRTKVTRARSAKFLNLMWPLMGEGFGSYYGENDPKMLDQFLVSKGLLTANSGFKVKPGSVEIVQFKEMVNKGTYPKPIRFSRGRTLNKKGFSDHFPISVSIKE